MWVIKMKAQLSNIIESFTDVYGFISCKSYKKERMDLNKDDYFSDYSFLDAYKTIITLGFPYPSSEVKWKGKGYGILARFSYSNDYHIVIQNMLDSIIVQLNSIGIKGKGSVDVSKVDEKYAAYLSGIGYFGKNSILIHKKYGSYMFLATILIDQEIKEDNMLFDDCGTCDLCIKACPTNALDHGFIRDQCISNLSQSKKEFSIDEIKQFKTVIYGCDICIKVCPRNKGIDTHKYSLFEPNEIENVELSSLLEMNNKAFDAHFGNNASHWIGAAQMKRNALCLIANQKLVDFIPQIRKSMDAYKDNLWYCKTALKVLEILEKDAI